MDARKSSDSSQTSVKNSKEWNKESKPQQSPKLRGFFEGKGLKPIDTAPLALVPTPREADIGPTPPPPGGTPSR